MARRAIRGAYHSARILERAHNRNGRYAQNPGSLPFGMDHLFPPSGTIQTSSIRLPQRGQPQCAYDQYVRDDDEDLAIQSRKMEGTDHFLWGDGAFERDGRAGHRFGRFGQIGLVAIAVTTAMIYNEGSATIRIREQKRLDIFIDWPTT